MAWYKTHEISYPNGIDVELHQDLGSAPGSVAKLPLVKQSRQIEFNCSTRYGWGIMSQRFEATFLNESSFYDLFTQANAKKIRLYIKDGATTLFDKGAFQLNTREKGISNRFNITFVDGFSRLARIKPDDYRFGITNNEDFVSNILYGIGQCANFDTLPAIYHDWLSYDDVYAMDEWSSAYWPTQLQRVTLKPEEWDEDYYKLWAQEITETFMGVIGYSSSAGRMVFTQHNIGFDVIADVTPELTGYLDDGDDAGTPFTSIDVELKVFDKVSKDWVNPDAFGYGKIAVSRQDNDPLDPVVESDADLGKQLKEFEYSIPFDYHFESGASGKEKGMTVYTDTSGATYAPEFWKRPGKDYSVIISEDLENVLEGYMDDNYGSGINYFRGTLRGVIDPSFPFIIDNATINSTRQMFRPLKGKIDLMTKKTIIDDSIMVEEE